MGVIERDPYTGHGTTGHEWNGIKELNTTVPWPIWAFLICSVAFAVLWWILMPAWPLGTTYTKGLLGNDVRKDVAAHLRAAAEERSVWMRRIEKEDFAAIQADPALMKNVREAGHALFGDNCAACHGIGATGGPGFPNLTDRAWLWGGTPDAVFQTIRVGVNSEHPDSRSSQMPAWGRDKMLKDSAINDVVAYVYSLSHPGGDGKSSAAQLAAGQKVFADNCAACHGADAKGKTEVGAPNLTDSFWLYGGGEASIYNTVYNGRQGHMPTWESRISKTDRKILTLYVLDLGRAPP
ncbi:MAG: Cytochrome c oxidase (cbb3-type) subunit CcoP [Pseudolabrys sp.]|jgi:cytochrome c oxidase cbb3-type subunit 3|nr:Cytochrome c oxidase (cbb3-type) subunit CcoP [Pseudolabrys sp.]